MGAGRAFTIVRNEEDCTTWSVQGDHDHDRRIKQSLGSSRLALRICEKNRGPGASPLLYFCVYVFVYTYSGWE